MVLLSEIDPYQHQAVEHGKTFNMNNYHPRYWLINGRGFPDSIADNGASWLPTQPYGALAEIQPYERHAPAPGAGALPQRRHRGLPLPPARQQRARDRPRRPPADRPGGPGPSFEKFAINIGPGQTWDVLFQWYDDEELRDREPGAGDGAQPGQPGDRHVLQRQPRTSASRSTLPPGHSTLNQCGEYYIICPQPRAVPDHVVGRDR